MDFGLGLPTSGAGATPEAIVRAAVEAERIGLATVWTFERLLRPTALASLPDDYASVYEPIETLAYVAARTDRVRLGTSVIDALFHPPVVLARRLATLDLLSGGRAVVGLGQGWMPEEFEVAEVPISRRGAGFQEHIEAMRAVWRADPVAFDGRVYRIPESQIGPKPVQPGGPPLLVGATTVPSAERAARMGLGLNPIVGQLGLATLDDLAEFVGAFRRAAEDAGHDPTVLPVAVRVNGPITEAPLTDRQPLTGSAEQIIDEIPRLEAIGITEVFWSSGTADAPDTQIRILTRLLTETSR